MDSHDATVSAIQQLAPQVTPTGLLVTVPAPGPDLATVS